MRGKVHLLNFALLDKNNDSKRATFEITNDKPNDNGWVNRTQGIDMRRFKKNRVVTFDHNDTLIVGKSISEKMEQVTRNKHRIISEMEFFQGSGGTYTDLAMEIYEMVDSDNLVGASVELIPYEASYGEEAMSLYKEDFDESPPKTWRETGLFGRKYMRESSLAKYSIVTTPANMDTLKIKHSLSDNFKSHITDRSDNLFEDVFGEETAGELIFYKSKYDETIKLLKDNGLEIKNGLILFNGADLGRVAEERKSIELRTEASKIAQQILKQLKG